MTFDGFPSKTTPFLKNLQKNNDRDWFKARKGDFEAHVQEPMLAFIRAVAPRLAKLSSHIVADDRKVGGSMMRIHRDTRFAKDKSPYNTWIAARFMHEKAKKTTAPGFYLRIDPKEVHLGAGIWQPETPALEKIRRHLVNNEKAWVKIRDDKKFKATWGDLAGDSLKRPPRGHDADHPLIEDLKRKDFVGFAVWKPSVITGKDFLADVMKAYGTSQKFMTFLCEALKLPY